MKKIFVLFAVVCALACFGLAQSLPDAPSNVYAFGPSFNSSATARVAGTALYARLLNADSGTYEFNVVDILPNTTKPFTVTTNVGVGVAQKLFSIGKFPIFVPASVNLSVNGSNTGWGWSGGALTSIKLKNEWHAYPNFRVVKSSVSNGTGYQPIIGLFVGWQK